MLRWWARHISASPMLSLASATVRCTELCQLINPLRIHCVMQPRVAWEYRYPMPYWWTRNFSASPMVPFASARVQCLGRYQSVDPLAHLLRNAVEGLRGHTDPADTDMLTINEYPSSPSSELRYFPPTMSVGGRMAKFPHSNARQLSCG